MNSFIVKLLQKWKWHLTIIVGAAVLLSAIFSGPAFIRSKFKSFAVIYPSNLIPYSSETPTEQMLQLLKSIDIRDEMIKNFNLLKHYNIDTSITRYSMLYEMFDENMMIKKTEYESVLIEVMDYDPDTASAMVTKMIDLFNRKAQSLQREKSHEVLRIKRDQMIAKKIEMDSMDRVFDELRTKYGLLDYDIQVEGVTMGIIEAKGSQIGVMDNLKRNLEEKGGELKAVKEHLWRTRGTYNDIKIEYENALKDVQKELTYSNVVTSSFPADKKSYPIRWLIVLLTATSTFLLSFIVIAILENDKL